MYRHRTAVIIASIVTGRTPLAELGHVAWSAASHPAYPTVSSLPSSQSLEQSHFSDISIQRIVPDSQVNQFRGHNCWYTPAATVGHAAVLHVSISLGEPLHKLPLLDGAGSVHVRDLDLTPVPHDCVQSPHCSHDAQLPSTRHGPVHD